MHYFIDPIDLPVQNAGDAFGPDLTDPAIKFNITSVFQLTTEAKAYACQTGLMIVQQSDEDDGLVNVVLKPDPIAGIYQQVEYFIYRGILKSSLIDDSTGNILAKNPSANNDLIKYIYDARPDETSYPASILGFDDNTLDESKNIEYIFSNSFTSVQAMRVREGVWFGNFTDDSIGFEIIIEADKINVSIAYVRKEKIVIDVSSLSGFELRCKRQQILSFIDPAAFFALNNEKGTLTGLINRFETKNRLYIDIRSEKGYSYNFYENYDDGSGNSIKISDTAQSYQTQEWPVIFIDRNAITDIIVNLRIDDNLHPVLFLKKQDAKGTDRNSSFVEIKGDITGWSYNLTLKFPDIPVYTYYLKAYYFHQIINPLAESPFIKANRYYNLAFCPVDLPNLADTAINLKWSPDPNYSYVAESLQHNGSGNFGFVSGNGACWDNNRILFYSNSHLQFRNSGKEYGPTVSRKMQFNSSYYKSNVQNRLDVNCKLHKKKMGTSLFEDIKILSIKNYRANNNNRYQESGLFLGLSMIEIAAVKAAAATINSSHHKYIFFKASLGMPFHDEDDITKPWFFEYLLQVQGLDSSGDLVYVTPQVTVEGVEYDIYVYSEDTFFFNSKSFSSSEAVSEQNLKIDIYSDGRIKSSEPITVAQAGRKVTYCYHDKNNQEHALCELLLEQINTLELGKKGYVRNGPPFTLSSLPTYQKPAPTHGTDENNDYEDYYNYPNGDIWVVKGSRVLWFKSLNKKGLQVYFRADSVNNKVINGKTLHITDNPSSNRFYGSPFAIAGFLGALIELISFVHVWSGGSFKNGTCSPSVSHVNGLGLDRRYINYDPNDRNWMPDTDLARENNKKLIRAMQRFGFHICYVGTEERYAELIINDKVEPLEDHENHIHFNFPNK